LQRVQIPCTSLYNRFGSAVSGAVMGDEHVDGGDNEEGEKGADGHAAHQHQADGIAGFRAGTGHQGKGKWPRWWRR